MANCIYCHGPELFEHLRDGYDDWRHRLFFAGVPIPAPYQLKRAAVVQMATGADVVEELIVLHKRKATADGA